MLQELLAKTADRKKASEQLSERDKYRGLGSKAFWVDTYKAKGADAVIEWYVSYPDFAADIHSELGLPPPLPLPLPAPAAAPAAAVSAEPAVVATPKMAAAPVADAKQPFAPAAVASAPAPAPAPAAVAAANAAASAAAAAVPVAATPAAAAPAAAAPAAVAPAAAQPHRRLRVVVLGCGNSLLSEQCAGDCDAAGSAHFEVVSMDYCDEVIGAMRAKHPRGGAHGNMTFRTMDVTDMRGFAAAEFDAAVDKGTLDALQCSAVGADLQRMFAETHRILKPNAPLFLVTHTKPDALQRIAPPAAWAYKSRPLGAGKVSLYTLRALPLAPASYPQQQQALEAASAAADCGSLTQCPL